MTERTPAPVAIDINEVMRRLPHRYPFLLVDRVLECHPGQSIVALKNVTINEEFFQGHFPGNPVMPGVLMLEALAQAAGLLAFITENVYPDQLAHFYFAGIDDVRFRKPVLPGDQLLLKAKIERIMRGIWKYSTVAEVAGVEVTSAKLLIAVGMKKKEGSV